MFPVPLYIRIKLRSPKLDIGCGHRRLRAIVTMPETSADLDQRPVFLEHDIGMSHDLLVTDPKAESLREQPFPDDNLRERVARTDRGHDFRAFFWRKLVHLP